MIVVDASIVAPMVLLDETPLPPDVVARLEAQPLVGPAHWPVETGNMLLVARRRGRIDERAWAIALRQLQQLRVAVAPPPDWRGLQETMSVAENHRLTLYDAAYLQLALESSATLATLDKALIAAARQVGLPVLLPS